MRRAEVKAWPALVLLAACGAEKSERVPAAKAAKAAPETPQRDPTADEIADMRAAAATLRLYYDNLGARDYRAAWALREQRPGLDFERFAESFARYRDYHADVGTPSFPAAADGFVWIDAPVQTWGTETSGARFGNVGRVLMKRRAGTRAWKLAP
jgi:hypothetical protein